MIGCKAALRSEHRLVELSLPFHRLFVQQRLDTDPAGLASEVAAEGVSAGEAPATAPVAAGPQLAFADEALLAAVQAFVAFAVVLAREGFAADSAYEGPLVGVRAQVRP